MSMDADGHQRRWLAFGYGGETSSPGTWRYWKTAERTWTIVAPNGLGQFEQRHRSIFYQGEEVLTGTTQWEATWGAVGYFYSHVVPKLPALQRTRVTARSTRPGQLRDIRANASAPKRR